jgi:putative FmdB family regulatory protein
MGFGVCRLPIAGHVTRSGGHRYNPRFGCPEAPGAPADRGAQAGRRPQVPLYEYECRKCHHRFEEIQSFSDPPIRKCPKCRTGKVVKQISRSAVRFKGTGWYVTDYAGKGKADKHDKGEKSDKTEKSDKGGKESKADTGKKHSGKD